MRVLMVVVALMAGCAEAVWWTPPTVDPESTEDVVAWTLQVHDAIDSWQAVLPRGCVFPIQVADDGMPMILLSDAAWIAQGLGAKTDGVFRQAQAIIYVRGSTVNDRVGIAAHELGHAAGWLQHSTDPTSVMYFVGTGSIRPTSKDGAILASILKCR